MLRCPYKINWTCDIKNNKTSQSTNSFQELTGSVKCMSLTFEDFNLNVSKMLNEMYNLKWKFVVCKKKSSQEIIELKYRLYSIEKNNINSIILIIGTYTIISE